MPDFHFHSSILLRHHSLNEVFPFLSTPEHLDELTPPWVDFSVLTPLPIEMRQGLVIQYRIRVRGVPLRWDSEIADWAPPFEFTDRQIRGPYSLWVHRHEFEETAEGTLAIDDIRYRVPGGSLVNRLYVAPELRRIFAYREARLREIFP